MVNSQTKKTKVTRTFIVDDVVRDDLLKILKISVDTENNLVYEDSSERVLSKDGREMKLDDFGGVIKGSTLIMRSDIDSLLNLAEELEN